MNNTVNLVISSVSDAFISWMESDIGMTFAAVVIVALVIRLVINILHITRKEL